MVQNNKVLTVSYGTFSCTLEGFDDSFETMKAIAEYFRDLAADDRYFGSEPPQPDAEMLTQIAQRNRARNIEASQSDDGLLLRAADEVPGPASPSVVAPTTVSQQTPSADDTAEFFADSEAGESAEEDSIAAKLQRIRAVVSHSGETTSRYSEDEEDGGGFVSPAQPPVDAISAAFEAGALSAGDLQENVEEEPTTAEAPSVEVAETDELSIQEPISEASAEDLAELIQEINAPDEVDAKDDVLLEGEIEETDVEITETIEVAAEIPEQKEPEEEVEVASSDVLFTDLEDDAALEIEPDEVVTTLEADQDTSEDQDEAISDEPEANQNILTAADEARLLDEISLVESELAIRTAYHEETGLEEDVSRLMDKADERFDDPSTSDQRETYSHLRTAVAAAEAERASKGAEGMEKSDKEYRDDLESVVSPRRPEVQVKSPRPGSTVAPLKLVAEQRIDTDDRDTGPVTPRRVTSDELEVDEEEGGFAHFAREQGAQSLPDLLEAAAAYLSFIEGQEQFSRPQLMNKVRSLKQESFNREESLRTFGQLLRDGKIEKAGGGRFAASNEIGFRPDDTRAAG
ncbi:hypothetical protein [Ruegeria arenilitoris]|uniref:hypothetical protein n=1 Tax=Ruegeria arenilitoris TaxID=1173585 RepID=UPI00147EF57C|nr:hypothetical protein [Ruegeria arenilitoris]